MRGIVEVEVEVGVGVGVDVGEGLGAAIHLLAQVLTEQIGDGQLAAGPGRHRAALATAGLDHGGHLPQPHEFQLPASKEKDIARVQSRDEGLLHMAEHGTAHNAHRDGPISGDRADVEPVQPGQGRCHNPIAEAAAGALGLADASLRPGFPFELAVAGIGTEAVAALLKKAQAPSPGVRIELAVAPAAAHGFQFQLGVEAGAAGQGHQMLQQHIERLDRRRAMFHQARRQSPADRRHLQQLQRMGGHEQELGGAAGAVGGAASALQQAGQVFGGTDLHHRLHRLEIDSQIQRAGADHPADLAGLHRRLDRLAPAALDRTVVQGQGPLHLRSGVAQALMPAFGLVAGVGEQQGGNLGLQLRHQLLVHAQAQMAGPREAVDALRQQAADGGAALQAGGDDRGGCGRGAAAAGPAADARGCLGRFGEIADRGADRPGAQFRPLPPQPAQGQLALAAALAAHQFMPFIEHNRFQAAEQAGSRRVGQQQTEGFGCGDQDFGRLAQLLAAHGAAGVAIAQAHPQRPTHGVDRRFDRQL